MDAFNAGLDESTLVEGTHTLAFGINVPKALGDFLVLEAVCESGGTATAVSDDDESLDERGDVGVPVVTRLLGGTVIREEER